ncbi:MAG: F390 synthetase-related protein [Bacteroidota bacterium]
MFFRLQVLWYFLRLRYARWRYRGRTADLQQHRWHRLRKTLLCSPFYAHLVLDGAPHADYPLMDKARFMARFNTINTLGIRRDEAEALAERAEQERDFAPLLNGVAVGLSSGTSGNRGIFLASKRERARWVAGVLDRVLGWSWRPRKVAFFLRANNQLYSAAGSRLLRFEFFDLLVPVPDHLQRLEKLQPDVLVGQPSLLLALADAIEAGSLDLQPTKIISVAEVLYPEDRQRLTRVFGRRIDEVYQCTEGFLATTCEHGNLHFNEDFLLVEKRYVDAERRRFHPVITDLLRTSQPVIRYELNDVVVPLAEPCPCGSAHLAIAAIEGRADDVLRFHDVTGAERMIFPDHFRRAIVGADPAIQDYELIARGVRELELFVAGAEATYQRAATAIHQFLTGQNIPNVGISRLPVSPHRPGQKLRRIRNDYR